MASRSKAFAAYLQDIYAEYDLAAERLADGNPVRFSASQSESAEADTATTPQNTDIESLILTIFMQVSKDQTEDLRDVLEEMQAITQAKQRQRKSLKKLKEAANLGDKDEETDDLRDDCAALEADDATQLIVAAAVRQWEAQLIALADEYIRIREYKRRAEAAGAARDELDSLSELGEMESLRLQMAMDRLSKIISTLSNLLKKLADTQASIVQNIK